MIPFSFQILVICLFLFLIILLKVFKEPTLDFSLFCICFLFHLFILLWHYLLFSLGLYGCLFLFLKLTLKAIDFFSVFISKYAFKAVIISQLQLHPTSFNRSHFHYHSVQNIFWFWVYSLTHDLLRNILSNFPTLG